MHEGIAPTVSMYTRYRSVQMVGGRSRHVGVEVCALWDLPASRCLRTFGIETPSSVASYRQHWEPGLITLFEACGRDFASVERRFIMPRTPNTGGRSVPDVASACGQGHRAHQNRFSALLDEAQRTFSAGRYGDTLSLVEDARALQGFRPSEDGSGPPRSGRTSFLTPGYPTRLVQADV